MHTRLSLTGTAVSMVLVLLVAGCSSKFAATTADGLALYPDSRFDALYLQPGADLAVYKSVQVGEAEVAFQKNWQREQNTTRVGMNRVSTEDMERIRAALATELQKVFAEELTKGGYMVVREAGDDVLLLRPAIVDLDISAPDLMTPGMNTTFTTTAGSMTLRMDIYDSTTHALLGRVIEKGRAADRRPVRVTNRVTNKQDADIILRRWARLIVQGLDAARADS